MAALMARADAPAGTALRAVLDAMVQKGAAGEAWNNGRRTGPPADRNAIHPETRACGRSQPHSDDSGG